MHVSMGGGAPDHRASAHEATHAHAQFSRASHARARGPVHARSMRILPARLRGAHTTTTKNDAATPACHRPMANAKKAAAMSEHVFTAEVVSVTTLATAPR